MAAAAPVMIMMLLPRCMFVCACWWICTENKACFPFYPDRPCRGFEDVLSRYNAITPGIAMSGPTNFAPGETARRHDGL